MSVFCREARLMSQKRIAAQTTDWSSHPPDGMTNVCQDNAILSNLRHRCRTWLPACTVHTSYFRSVECRAERRIHIHLELQFYGSKQPFGSWWISEARGLDQEKKLTPPVPRSGYRGSYRRVESYLTGVYWMRHYCLRYNGTRLLTARKHPETLLITTVFPPSFVVW